MPFLHGEQNIAVIFPDFIACHAANLVIGKVAGGLLRKLPGGTGAVLPVAVARELFGPEASAFRERKCRGERDTRTDGIPCVVGNVRERNIRIQLLKFRTFTAESDHGFLFLCQFLSQPVQFFAEC